MAAGAPDTVTPPLPRVLRLPLLAQRLGLRAVRSTGAGGPTGLHTAERGHAGQWDEGNCTRAGCVYGEEVRGRGRGPWGLHKVFREDRCSGAMAAAQRLGVFAMQLCSSPSPVSDAPATCSLTPALHGPSLVMQHPCYPSTLLQPRTYPGPPPLPCQRPPQPPLNPH